MKKLSSRSTMLTAAVLVTLSSGTAFAATPGTGTVDSRELFHADRLVTDSAPRTTVKEAVTGDQYEASISKNKKKTAAPAALPLATTKAEGSPAPAALPPATTKTQGAPASQRVVRLRWNDVDKQLSSRKEAPRTLVPQKAKPVIITAEDVRREKALAEKEKRAPRDLVGHTNTPSQGLPHVQVVPQNEPPRVIPPRPVPPPPPPSRQNIPQAPKYNPSQHAAQSYTPSASSSSAAAQNANTQKNAQSGYIPGTAQGSQSAGNPPSYTGKSGNTYQPSTQSYNQASSSNVGNAARSGQYDPLSAASHDVYTPSNSNATVSAPERVRPQGVPDYRIKPEGVPDFVPLYKQRPDTGLEGISEEVRRNILAGQMAMAEQLRRDPTVAGMRAIMQMLRDNTKLTRAQKIDFIIGFGRAIHRTQLSYQEQTVLIKAVAEAY